MLDSFLALLARFSTLLANLEAPTAMWYELLATFALPNVSTATARLAAGAFPEFLRTETFHKYFTAFLFRSKIPALFCDKYNIDFKARSMIYT